jgi:hypothetical protein
MQRIKAQLPAPTEMMQQGDAYLSGLHAKKVDATAARKERERRRRKVKRAPMRRGVS